MKKKIRTIALLIIIGLAIVLGIYLLVRETSHPEASEEEVYVPRMAYNINIDSLNITYGEVQKNENLSEILTPFVGYRMVDKLARTTRDIFDVRKIRPGNPYAVIQTNDSLKQTLFFVYEITKTDFVVYDFRDSLRVYRDEKPVTKKIKAAKGTIESSLWNAFIDQGIDINLALKMADIYAWTVDFYGIQKGDRFKLIYEELSIDTVPIGIGKVMGAEFQTSDNNFYAFYFEQDSIGNYFDETGENLQRTFLKAPLRFSRISSRFTGKRMHPILKRYTSHYGVDYAAPKGTPVVALGDGKVVMAKWNGGYGHYVKIKHNSVYSTGYGHLSKYGKGIKAGVYVKQGDVIGYVGSTGLSTGPHLDFRVYKNKTPIDPLKMESPPAEPVSKKNQDAYMEKIKPLKYSLDYILAFPDEQKEKAQDSIPEDSML
jgi:murein DD-endopeptidase MepM/ murein hydrolase activator NlpD